MLLTAFNLPAQNEQFFKALHQVETSGRTGAIYGDQNRSLGMYQISKPYWLDATEKRPDLRKQGYGRVVEEAYAQQIVRLYMKRYCKGGTVEQMARCHNSGWNWRKKYHLTDNYWNKFKKHLK